VTAASFFRVKKWFRLAHLVLFSLARALQGGKKMCAACRHFFSRRCKARDSEKGKPWRGRCKEGKKCVRRAATFFPDAARPVTGLALRQV
jgi:hypothetical protein